MKFVKLTKKEGQKISINADKVLYFEQLEEETIIHFSNGTVSVTEKADDIVSVFKQEEVESKENQNDINKKEESTPEANPFRKYKAE